MNVRCRESVPTSALSRLEIMIRFSRNYNGLMNTGSLLGSVEEMIPGLLSRYFEKSLLGDDIYTPPPPSAVPFGGWTAPHQERQNLGHPVPCPDQ